METCEFVLTLLGRLPERSVVVCTLGRTGEEVHRSGYEPTLFTDTMGDVSAVALGMALAAPEVFVLALDTDGSFLMNLSVLPVLGHVLPAVPNLGLTICDNRMYESAGGMPSRGCALSWEDLFGSVGLDARVVRHPAGIPDRIGGGVLVAELLDTTKPPASTRTVDGVESAYRVEAALREMRGLPARRPAVKS